MFLTNFYKEAEKLEEGAEKRIVEGNDFDITLMKGPGPLHTCAKDEFFCVLKGEGELQVEGKLYTLKEGEGIMVKAGEKHRRGTKGACWLIISKHPHKHVFFEK